MPGTEAVVDCMSAILSHSGGCQYATGPHRPFAGLWLDWGRSWNVDKVHKVKAHDSITDRHKEGNSVVDELAKGTAWEHLGPVLVAENYKKGVEERVQFYRQVARRLAAWLTNLSADVLAIKTGGSTPSIAPGSSSRRQDA